MSVESTVRQTDYGIKPYSLLMGSVQVADEVSVTFTAVHAKAIDLGGVTADDQGCGLRRGECGESTAESPVSPGMCSSTRVK